VQGRQRAGALSSIHLILADQRLIEEAQTLSTVASA